MIEVTADKLLSSYNEKVNSEAPFSIWRVCDKLYGGIRDDESYSQKNSGMLGVHGNIGFSTAFHGFHAEAAIKRDTGCGVGDDALGGTTEDPRDRFIPHLQLIGDLATEKVTILPPLQEHESEQIAKFVKRRFTRTHDGIIIGMLLAFPSLAGPFGVSDPYHTLPDDPESVVIAKFCGQVGSFLWDILALGHIDRCEQDLINAIFSSTYRKLGLPFTGSLPGLKHRAFEDRIMFCVPPLFFDFTSQDWSEFLWDNSQAPWALLPIHMGPILIPPYENGKWFEANESGTLNVLEDIGTIRKGRMLTEWVEVSVTNKRRFKSFLSGQKRSYQCQFLDFVPEWYDRVFSSYDAVPSDRVVDLL